jgi:hypothetical protein
MILMRLFLSFILLASFARAEVYEPKPGTTERKAIMDAMRVPVAKQVGEPVEFTGTVKVSGAWARFEGNVGTKSGKPPKKEDARFDLELDFFALLRNEKGEWKVLSWGFAGDIGAYEEAKKKFPKAPKDLMPDLPSQ